MLKKSESEFYSNFKVLRNRLKNYSKYDLFDSCMKNLTDIWGIDFADLPKLNMPIPTNLFLLMKWGICYGEYPQLSKKQLRIDNFKEFYATITDLPAFSHLLKIEDPFGLSKFIRAYAPHQFYYQQNHGLYGICVLDTIINQIGIKYDCDKLIKDRIGIPLGTFIDLQFFVFVVINSQEKYRAYSLDYFKHLYNYYSKDIIEKFLDFMSNDYNSIYNFFQKDHDVIGNPEYETTLLTPLYKKPLFKNGNLYYPYHKCLLDANIQYGVYEIMKAYDAPNFCSAFGTGFEEYISSSISNYTKNYLREKDLRNITHKERACDFVVPEEKYSFFIEAKSAEMYYLTRQNPQKEHLKRTLENSLISGYKQIFTLAYYLNSTNHTLTNGKIPVGFIITYKNLFLGHPDEIWEDFMYQIMKDSLHEDIFNNLLVAPSNIYVMSVLEFDYMLLYASRFNKSLSECINLIETNNKIPNTRKIFTYDNFTEKIDVLAVPQLSNSVKGIKDRISLALANKL